MALRRGFPSPRSRSPKRLTAWGLGPKTANNQFSSASSIGWDTGAAITAQSRVTIVRTRGIFKVYLVAASAIVSGFSGAAGIGIVSLDAFAAGALPDPVADVGWPGWLWHTFFDVRSITATLADGVNAQVATFETEIDSKAMRKFGQDETLMGVSETDAEVATADIRVFADTRILFKLS